MSVPTLIRTSLVLIRLMLIAALGQGGEHAGGDAGVGAHAHADDRELGQGRLDRDLPSGNRLDGLGGPVSGLARHGEREDGVAVLATFWTIMSTNTPASAIARKTMAA